MFQIFHSVMCNFHTHCIKVSNTSQFERIEIVQEGENVFSLLYILSTNSQAMYIAYLVSMSV